MKTVSVPYWDFVLLEAKKRNVSPNWFSTQLSEGRFPEIKIRGQHKHKTVALPAEKAKPVLMFRFERRMKEWWQCDCGNPAIIRIQGSQWVCFRCLHAPPPWHKSPGEAEEEDQLNIKDYAFSLPPIEQCIRPSKMGRRTDHLYL